MLDASVIGDTHPKAFDLSSGTLDGRFDRPRCRPETPATASERGDGMEAMLCERQDDASAEPRASPGHQRDATPVHGISLSLPVG